jgi:hypothetical protein
MLAAIRPPRLDPSRTVVEFYDDRVDVRLAHSAADEDVWATVGHRDAIVRTGVVHEHFLEPPAAIPGDRPWTTQAVDFIAEVLRGEIEIETTFRGETPVAVEHFNRTDSGERRTLGYIGFLVPGRLLVWRPKRVQTRRVSFL